MKMLYDRLRLPFELSTLRSRDRREKYYKHRTTVRLLSIPAVLGMMVLAYFVTLDFPVEELWWGLIGIFLVVPFLVKLTERSW